MARPPQLVPSGVGGRSRAGAVPYLWYISLVFSYVGLMGSS